MRLGVIWNPRSGRGAGARVWPKLEPRLKGLGLVAAEPTTGPGSAQAQARRLAESCDVLAALGGDGTVTDVMQGLLGTSTALAILPLGTGNDFARTLGFGTSLDKALAALKGGRRMRIDVAHWSHGDQQGHFMNVSGCGFDAIVAARINSGISGLTGKSAYLAAIFQTLATYHPAELRLTVDGVEMTCLATLCAFANARSYGGGMEIAPMADPSDGWLDLIMVQGLSRFETLLALPKLLKGTHMSLAKVSHQRFQRLVVECDAAMPYLLDGECLSPGRLEIEVVPSAVEVIAP